MELEATGAVLAGSSSEALMNGDFIATAIQATNLDSENTQEKKEKQEGDEKPEMNLIVTIALLVVVTVVGWVDYFGGGSEWIINSISWQLTAVTAEWLLDSISGLTSSGHIKEEFVGIILLPIVGNAAGRYQHGGIIYGL